MKTKTIVLTLALCLLALGCGNLGELPTPMLNGIFPATAMVGSSDLNLVLLGTGFTDTSSVLINGTVVSSTLANRFNLRATIPTSLLDSPSMLSVSVSNGDAVTSSKTLTVLSVGTVSSTNNPQVAQYSFNSPRDATVTIEFGPDTNYGLKTWTLPTTAQGGHVDIFVAGMRAFTTYHMRAIVEFPDGVIHLDADHTFTTGGLPPERIPSLTVSQTGNLLPAPGVQLSILTRGDPEVKNIVTDLDGNIIWFYDHPSLSLIEFTPNGNAIGFDRDIVQEVDLAGNIIREITRSELNQSLETKGFDLFIRRFHHDVRMLPNGNILILTDHIKTFTNMVGFEGQAIELIGDALVELDESWQPIWVWSSFDHLDVNRSFLGTPPDPQRQFDWTHGNAVTYSPADGNLLLSLRHQHWVLKIDYQDGFGSGNILWRLGLDGDFTLLNGEPADWQYGQHFPFIIDNQIGFFRLAVFDNGNNRVLDESGTVCVINPAAIQAETNFMLGMAGNETVPKSETKAVITGETPCFSRAVIFELDESMKTARVDWEDKLTFIAPFIGSIQVLDNENVLYDAGAVDGTRNAIVREVTQENPPQTVWQLDFSGRFVYRSLRLPSLYPGVQW